jgi:hypothetical protein
MDGCVVLFKSSFSRRQASQPAEHAISDVPTSPRKGRIPWRVLPFPVTPPDEAMVSYFIDTEGKGAIRGDAAGDT